MEITKAKVIEILEAALTNRNYLDDRSDSSTNWFCASISQILIAKYDDSDDREFIQEQICNEYVYPSINQCLFLKSYLQNTGAIPNGTLYSDTVYKIAARNHWATLIKKLKETPVE